MRKTLLLAALLFAAPALAAPPQSDDQISSLLKGSWVSVPAPERIADHLLIQFKDAGDATAYFFKEDACKNLLFRADVHWSVENGVLITRYPEGYSDHDIVQDISDKSVTFLSRERQEPYTRVRSTACKPPANY